MTLLQWEARVPKADMWRTILAWAKFKEENLEWREQGDGYTQSLFAWKHWSQSRSEHKVYTLTKSKQDSGVGNNSSLG
jgi:hypothetical protein